MPENDAPIQAFYDHEIDEPRAIGRRRRQVADWGVGEDVFDRLPSRRFARAERRSEDERHRAPRAEDSLPRGRFDREPAEQPSPRTRRRPAADWLDEVTPRVAEDPKAWTEPEAPRRTIVIGGDVDGEVIVDGRAEAEAAPPRAIVLDGDVDGEVVIEDEGPRRSADEAEDRRADAPRPRRTIVIGGHPDKLPPPRPRRPPRTALERVGASPDRLAGYAVALGLLLILIAVLTTSH